MNKHQQKIILAFLLPVYVLAVFKLVWPDRELSVQENRTLQQLPSFSLEEFFSGDFNRDLESWYSDQFPFRELFIDVNTGVASLARISFSDDDVTLIQGPANDLGSGQHLDNTGETIPAKTDPVTETLPTTSQTEPTESEPETSASEPVVSESTATTPTTATAPSETTKSANPTETTATTAPSNDQNPTDDEVTSYSAVIIVNNMAMELYGFNAGKADYYASLVSRLQSKTPQSQVYSLLAPTAIEFYSPEKYHTLSSSQKSSIDYTYGQMSPQIIKVDAYSTLSANTKDYLYFRSDHHWTAMGAYRGYQAYAQAAGFQAVPLESLNHGSIAGGFLGSLYRYTKSAQLKENPDTVFYYEPVVQTSGMAYQDVSMTGGRSIQLINKNAGTGSQYLAFIEGDHPLAHFQSSVKNSRKVLVVKESYGNALVPYLASHYEEIYVVDPRQIKMDLPAFIAQQSINDILVINYSFAVSNPTWIKGFENMIGG